MFLLFNMILMYFWFMICFFIFLPSVLRMFYWYMFCTILCMVVFLNMFYNKIMFWYQFMLIFYKSLLFNMELSWGFDMLSLNLMLLSTFLLCMCFMSYWHLKYKSLYYFYILNISLWILINVFSSLDFFYFFVFFELMVIPMFFLMGMWGSSSRKMTAAYQLFLYTLLGSMFIFMSMFDVLLNKGNLSFDFFLNSLFYEKSQLIMWIFLFMGFSVKMPMVPFHLWLPEAHVEAPTPGSVMLAGMLLKLGSYAMLRFLLGSFWYISYDLVFFMLIMALFSLTHTSMVALCQMDMKKMMAYSSVAHMNYSLMGLFSKDVMGLAGSYMMIYSHAITSSALFLAMGVLYDSYKTRLMFYYGGLVIYMPMFSILFFIFVLSNFGFPGTFNFMGEFLLTYSMMSFSFVMGLMTTFSLVLSLIYSLFLYNSIFFGNIKMYFMKYYNDITSLEFYFLFFFFFFMLFYGLMPLYMLDGIYYFMYKLKFYMM